MARVQRILQRNREKSFSKTLKKTEELLKDPVLVAKLKQSGVFICPKCNEPIVSGFGTLTGDYGLCQTCGEVPLSSDDNSND